MANIIDQLEISGIVYDIQDASAQAALSGKQDTLVSGVNIKTINNESLLGSGNIEIQGGTGDAYTKAETDALLAAKADTSTVTSAVTEFSAALGNEIQRAQGVEQVLSGAIDTKVDSSDVYLKTQTSSSTEINNALQAKADASTTYSKTEVDNAINAATSGKADTSTVTSAVSEFSTALSNEIQRAQEAEQVISGAVDTKANSSDVYLKSETSSSTEINNALQTKADASTTYSKTETDNAINAAVSGKADTSAVTNSINAAVSGKQDTLVSGTNIKTINNESLLGSGNITIQGGGANVVELTQAEYDALVSKDPDTFYVISDATEIDANNFYLKTQTSSSTQIAAALQAKADASTTSSATQISDALAGKQNTLTAGTGISISNDVISVTGGGGGGSYTAGRGISISNDQISLDVPVYKADRIGSSAVIGLDNIASVQGASDCLVGGYYCGIENADPSAKYGCVAMGMQVTTKNGAEAALGKHNLPTSASTTFGDSGNTLFTVGNGQAFSARHNAFEVRANGDIYFPDTNNTTYQNFYEKPMLKLQDVLADKQDVLTAGTGIDITNNVISVTGGGGGGTIDAALDANSPNAVANSAITAGINNAVTSATAEFTNVYSALARKQPMLTAGTGIDITDNVISVTGGGGGGGGKAVSAGTNISITTGETADTVNCTLPITANTSARKNDIAFGTDIINGASNQYRIVIGNGNKIKYASSRASNVILIGTASNNSSFYNTVNSSYCIGIGGGGIEVGYDNYPSYGSIAIGYGTKSIINCSLAIGYNAVASGTTKTNINDQIKVDTDNQVYIKDSSNTNEICIQDKFDTIEATIGDINTILSSL